MRISRETLHNVGRTLEESLSTTHTTYPDDMSLEAFKQIVTKKATEAFKACGISGVVPNVSVNWNYEKGEDSAMYDPEDNACMEATVSIKANGKYHSVFGVFAIGHSAGLDYDGFDDKEGAGADNSDCTLEGVSDIEVSEYIETWKPFWEV